MNAKLFINYRREDTRHAAGRLYDHLTTHFGKDQVFMDIDQIDPGDDFVEVINRKVSTCDIAIVAIGRHWLGATDASGKRRLDNEEDFVRMEIVAAFQRNIRVIPVLVDGAQMPGRHDLPEALAQLCRRNAIELSDTRFHADVNRLIEAIKRSLAVVEKEAELSATPAAPPPVPAALPFALLKLIAGIIRAPFDALHQPERQRQIRIRLGASIVAMMVTVGLIYIAVADAGLHIPLGKAIRTSLDRHELSVFRPVHSDAEIQTTAARLRDDLVGVIRERLQDGWISSKPPAMGHVSDLWAHSQALFAIYRMPDHNDAQREFLPALEIPFASSLEINEPHRRYRWIDNSGAEYDKSIPILWLAAAEGAALAVPHLLEGNQRESVLRHFEYVQEILKEYRPTTSGGWNLFPSQKDPNEHHVYSITLALHALLQAHHANLPWEGSVERRDQLIMKTAQLLAAGFDPTGSPPGWHGFREDTKEIYGGLTIQIFDELLQTQKALPDFSIRSEILQEIPRQLALFVARDLSDTRNQFGEFMADYTRFEGKEAKGKEEIRYLWYPWVIHCSVNWLEFAGKHQLPKEERVRVRRALGHLVVDLGQEALKRAREEYTFFASENLYGLTAIDPPPGSVVTPAESSDSAWARIIAQSSSPLPSPSSSVASSPSSP